MFNRTAHFGFSFWRPAGFLTGPGVLSPAAPSARSPAVPGNITSAFVGLIRSGAHSHTAAIDRL